VVKIDIHHHVLVSINNSAKTSKFAKFALVGQQIAVVVEV